MRSAGRRWIAVVSVGVCLAASGCGSGGRSEVEKAQAGVEDAQADLADARTDAETAADEFCTDASDYITALDRYGDVLHATKPTVGDVLDSGADLAEPADDVRSSVQRASDARAEVVAAEQALADAEAQLAIAHGKSATPAASPAATPTAGVSPSSSATALVPEPPAASVTRIEQAQTDLDAAVEGVSEQTPLAQATEQLNAAAVALEMSWLRLFAEVGCLDSEQQERAAAAVADYTTKLQEALADTGHYTGGVDGVYGPATVEAVQSVQRAHGLPTTGTVDKATAAALRSELAAQGGAHHTKSVASTAAVQQTLKLAGYWDGPVDGTWTPALTEALTSFQEHLGVSPTGTVDAATVSAVEQAIAAATVPPTPTASMSPSTSASMSPSG